MGFRTTVILFNDQAHEWENDPLLGKKIARAMNHAMGKRDEQAEIGYGRVVECAHADTQTVAVLDSYNMTQVAHSSWRRGESEEERNVRLLKEMAEKLGYTVSRKRAR